MLREKKLYNKSFVPTKFSYLPPPLWWHTAGWMWVFLVQKPFKVHGKMRCAENANNGNCTHWSRIDKVVYQQAAFIALEFGGLSEMYFCNHYKSCKMVKFRSSVLAALGFMDFNEFLGPREAWLCNFDIFLTSLFLQFFSQNRSVWTDEHTETQNRSLVTRYLIILRTLFIQKKFTV